MRKALKEAEALQKKLTLQWGRNMRVAESPTLEERAIARVILQWGRNMRVAESIARGK